MPDTTDLQKRLRDYGPSKNPPRTIAILSEAADALEAQQAELTLLREVTKRAETFLKAIAEEDNFWPGEPESIDLNASLQALKEFQKGER